MPQKSKSELAIREPLSPESAQAIERVLIMGDLSKLSEQQCVDYYLTTCNSLGLNPLTKPFSYLMLNGKKVLYATRDCTDQLRKVNGVSILELIESVQEGVFIVKAKGSDKTGRTDASTGAVNISGLKGEALANAMMKAETKAKRRLTLSICGLGMLDETEVGSIPGATMQEANLEPRPETRTVDAVQRPEPVAPVPRPAQTAKPAQPAKAATPKPNGPPKADIPNTSTVPKETKSSVTDNPLPTTAAAPQPAPKRLTNSERGGKLASRVKASTGNLTAFMFRELNATPDTIRSVPSAKMTAAIVALEMTADKFVADQVRALICDDATTLDPSTRSYFNMAYATELDKAGLTKQ